MKEDGGSHFQLYMFKGGGSPTSPHPSPVTGSPGRSPVSGPAPGPLPSSASPLPGQPPWRTGKGHERHGGPTPAAQVSSSSRLSALRPTTSVAPARRSLRCPGLPPTGVLAEPRSPGRGSVVSFAAKRTGHRRPSLASDRQRAGSPKDAPHSCASPPDAPHQTPGRAPAVAPAP